MSLRLFCDQYVPAEIRDILQKQGFDVILLRDVLPVRSPDSAVIAKAAATRGCPGLTQRRFFGYRDIST